MIQRIQTVYLIIATALVVWAGLGTSFVSFNVSVPKSEDHINFNLNGYGWQAKTHFAETQQLNSQQAQDKGMALEIKGDSTTSSNYFPIYVVFIALSILFLVTIFFYKNLKKQMRFAKIALFFLVLVIIALSLYIMIVPDSLVEYCSSIFSKPWEVKSKLGMEFYLLCSALPFAFLAIRGIRKDTKLLQSLDRIR
ncbi:MAG: DUF4293 family protein [Crocinitomicaceae bacterium]